MKKLSEQLQDARTDRPDEWTMDRFIEMAEELEATIETAKGWVVDIQSSLRPAIQTTQSAMDDANMAKKVLEKLLS